MRLPALNFEARVLAPLSCPLLDLSQATSLQEKKVGPAGLTLQGPLRYPHGTGSQLSRISGRPSAGGPPHLEEGGAPPRRDVTAPGTRGGSLGGARGPQGAWPGSPDHSREISPQPGRGSLHPGPVGSTSFSSVARSASASEGVGVGCRCETPRVPQPTGSGRSPGSVAQCALCAGADPARPRLPGPGPRLRPRPGVRSCGARRSRADGGASPARLSRCTEGAALSPPEPQHG